MRRRALERMQDLIQEATRLHHQQYQHQHVSELRPPHTHQEWEQEHQYRYQQERAKSPVPAFAPRFSLEEAEFSATTMTVPSSFSDEGGSAENENVTRNSNSEEVEDDLETVTDGSSVHTPSSASHIGIGFMGGHSPTSPTSTNTHPPGLPPKSTPNPQPSLPPHFQFEYTQLTRLRQRLHSLIIFADSQMRITAEEKRNRDEILLVRGRRRAWLNGELALGKGNTNNEMGQMQWGFAAPFKSSPLARYSWSASAELDQSTISANDANDTSVCLPNDVQQQQEDEEGEDEYSEFNGPLALRKPTLNYNTLGRRSRRSRYSNGEEKLPPVLEECEYENCTFDVNSNVTGTGQSCKLSGLNHHHRHDSFLHLQEDEDTDSLSDGFSLEDPRELDLELGFGLQDPTSFIGGEGDGFLNDGSAANRHSEPVPVQEQGQKERQRLSGESARVAFEMERPKIVPRVRDGVDDTDNDSMLPAAAGTSSSTSTTRLLSWGYWGVGKNSGDGDDAAASRKNRSWKNGIGIGLGSRGRSVNKTCQRRESEREQEELRGRVSTSSTSSSTSTSSDKSQQQQQRESMQVELEPELDHSCSSTTHPDLCQPTSFSVSHIPAITPPASTSTSPAMTIAVPPPNDTTTPPTTDTATNSIKTFVSTSLSFSTKKLCMASPAPNVYADLDVSVVRVGDEDNKGLNLSFGATQSGVASHATGTGAQVQSHGPGHAPRLRPRRHKREYQYQYPHQHHHHHLHETDDAYNNNGEDDDDCDEFELAGYGQFAGGPSDTCLPFSKTHQHQHHQHHHQHQQKHNNPMRFHLDELLLEEGLFGYDTGIPLSDQEEFTLAMDIPVSCGGGGGGGGSSGRRKALKKIQYLQLHQNRDSASQQQQSRPLLSQQQLHHHPVQQSSSSVLVPSSSPPDSMT